MNKIINTTNAPAPVGPYSQAVQTGPFLFCSGQIAIDPKTNTLLKGSPTEEMELIFSNVKAVLSAADYDLSNVVKVTLFLTDMGDFAAVNEIYTKYFNSSKPARSCVQAAALPKGVQVEMEVLAYKEN